MKPFYFYIACLLLSLAGHAEEGPKAAAAKIAATQGSVKFQFDNIIESEVAKDSVLIIFDRCDHTGAGVVYQVFYADKDQNIAIPAVPAGKYYVTIQCLGLHHDHMEKVVTIKSQKSEQVKISLAAIEEFQKDKVVIPAYRPNVSDLASFRTK